MIAFITIFLGLVTGVKPVEFAVSGDVAEIEVRLDGEVAGWLREEPWTLECDFGSDLTTHELVAIARGPRGQELARLEQLINVPRPPIDTQILLEDWQDGRPRSARLLLQTVEPVEPLTVTVTLDGAILAERWAERYRLPKLDPESIHFMSARLELPDNQVSTAEVVFGGAYGSATETELTAIPLLVAGRKLRRADKLQGRLLEDGKALRVFALEDGPAEVVVVRDQRALVPLKTLATRTHGYSYAGLAEGDTLRVLSPRAYLAGYPDPQYAVFPLSPPMTGKNAPVPSILASVKFTNSPVLPQRLTDAVATAGLRAASSQTRRVVVLVTTDCADVSGQWDPDAVSRFLAQLRVPFRVWQISEPSAAAAEAGGFCAGVQAIHDGGSYHTAVRHLRRDLLAQQIVWVEGRHLQRKITLARDEPGLRLVD